MAMIAPAKITRPAMISKMSGGGTPRTIRRRPVSACTREQAVLPGALTGQDQHARGDDRGEVDQQLNSRSNGPTRHQ